MVNFYAITVATKDGGYYDCLKHTCDKNDIKLITLGWNKEWKGFSWRWELYKEYISDLNDDDIVMWIDAYDILVTEHKDNIIDKFKKFNTGIVFGEDKSTSSKLFFKLCDKGILSGGSHIGYVKIVKMLIELMLDEKLIKKWNKDDQHMLNDLFCSNDFFAKHTKKDVDSEIFYIAGSSDQMTYNYIANGRLNLKKMPSVIHGTAGLDMSSYGKDFGCDVNKFCKPNMWFKSKQGFYIFLNGIHMYTDTLCIIFMIVIIYLICSNKLF